MLEANHRRARWYDVQFRVFSFPLVTVQDLKRWKFGLWTTKTSTKTTKNTRKGMALRNISIIFRLAYQLVIFRLIHLHSHLPKNLKWKSDSHQYFMSVYLPDIICLKVHTPRSKTIPVAIPARVHNSRDPQKMIRLCGQPSGGDVIGWWGRINNVFNICSVRDAYSLRHLPPELRQTSVLLNDELGVAIRGNSQRLKAKNLFVLSI